MRIKAKISRAINNKYTLYLKSEAIKKRERVWQTWLERSLSQANGSPLSKTEADEVSAFYAPYIKVNTAYHDFYKRSTGMFDVRFIPDDIQACYIDPYFNNWDEALLLDNKTYYKFIFHDVKQPRLIAARSGGVWTDENDQFLSKKDIIHRVTNSKETLI